MKKLFLALVSALGLTITLVPVDSFAGKLDDFETSATKKKHEKRDSRGHPRSEEDRDDNHHHNSDDGCHGFFSCLFSIFIHVDASSSSADTDDDTQKPDNPKNSLVTFDAAFQNIDSTIFGVDSNFQLRLKRVNIEGRLTRYVETSPFTTLDVNQLKVVYPIRLGRSVTIGGGLGIYNLTGNSSNTGGSFSLPITYQAPGSYWEFGMIPSWATINGNTISDLDFRVSYRTNKINFFTGHRAIDTGSQSLSGPYFGIGFNI